jgi:hypothetical protein
MKTFKLLTFIMIGIISFGCQKSGNKGGNGVQTQNPNNQEISCTNCQNINQSQVLLQNIQSQTWAQDITFDLQIYGTPVTGCIQPVNKQILCAQGNGFFSGIMRVQNGNILCGIPNGDYTLQPTQASQLSNAMLTGGQYQAIGPNNTRIILQLQSGILYNPSGLDLYSTQNRIGLTATILRADGATCGWLYTN